MNEIASNLPPLDEDDASYAISSSSTDNSIFDRPLPQQTLSQPSCRMHVTWDGVQIPVNEVSPIKQNIYKTPILEIPKQDAKKTDEIDDIIRGLSVEPHRLQTSPIGSDDEDFQYEQNPFLMEDLSSQIIEKNDFGTLKYTENNTPSPLSQTPLATSENQSDNDSELEMPQEIELSPIQIKQKLETLFDSPKSIESPKETAKSEPSSVFLAQPKNVYTYDEQEKPSVSEITNLIENFETQNIVPSVEKSQYIEQYLERNRVKYIMEGNYAEAEKCDKLAVKIRHAVAENNKIDRSSDKMIFLNNKLDEAKSEYNSVKQNLELRYNILKKECYRKIDELDNDQQKELDKFDSKWDDPVFLRSYSKPSKDLITLRKLEKKLIILKRYEEASQIRKKADKLEESETEESQQRGLVEMVKQRNALVQKHQEDMENYIKKLKANLEKEKKKKEEEYQKHEKEIARIEKMIEDYKNVPPEWRPRPDSKVSTPRTISKLIKFKKESYFKPLKIKPMRSLSRKVEKKKIIVGSKPDFEI